jgi:hypothetical protein
MKKLLLFNWVVSLFYIGSCQTDQDYIRKGHFIIRDLRKDFQQVHSYEDLLQKDAKLKKKMKRLTTLMIKASDFSSKEIVEGEWSDLALENDRLRYEMHRICIEVEGSKKWLEDVQADMLDKLDIYERKIGKK